jgi:quercetin dioxygenase-like cupin family protein
MLLQPGNGRELPLIGRLQASGADTAGAFELIEFTGPSTPPPHVHKEHDEIFVVLSGTFQFLLDRDTVEALAGAVVVVPRGWRHGFTMEPGSTALLLAIPAGLGDYFKELSARLADGKPGLAVRTDLAGQYDFYPDQPT